MQCLWHLVGKFTFGGSTSRCSVLSRVSYHLGHCKTLNTFQHLVVGDYDNSVQSMRPVNTGLKHLMHFCLFCTMQVIKGQLYLQTSDRFLRPATVTYHQHNGRSSEEPDESTSHKMFKSCKAPSPKRRRPCAKKPSGCSTKEKSPLQTVVGRHVVLRSGAFLVRNICTVKQKFFTHLMIHYTLILVVSLNLIVLQLTIIVANGTSYSFGCLRWSQTVRQCCLRQQSRTTQQTMVTQQLLPIAKPTQVSEAIWTEHACLNHFSGKQLKQIL